MHGTPKIKGYIGLERDEKNYDALVYMSKRRIRDIIKMT